MKYKDKIILYAAFTSVAAWVLDAVVDSLFFNSEPFLDALGLGVPAHELYFRSFMAATIMLFGVIISRSLSQKQNAENELLRALARLEDEKVRSEAVIAAIPDGISIQDRNFRVIYQNDVHRSLVGDQVGQLCYEKYSKRDSICPGCPVALVFRDGGRHVLEKTRTDEKGTICIEIGASALRNASGEIVAGIEAVRDVTQRKKAEEYLRLFSQAIDGSMDGIQIVDLQGKIVYSNRAVEEIYGYAARELMGRPVGDMNADPGYAESVILPGIRKNGSWSGEVFVKHKDGTTFPVWLSTSLVRNPRGESIAMVGIIRDVTERKRVEEELQKHREQLARLVDERTTELREANEQLQREISEREHMESELSRIQKLESVGILAGGIAHDFNNLLGSIMGNISLALLDVPASSPAHDALDKAERASVRAQDLTRQLLTFSRGGAPMKKPVSLPMLVAEAASFSLRGAKVLHELSFPGDLWPVEADEGQMMQVFNNILINADQAMPKGGIIRITGQNVTLKEDEVPSLAAGRYVRVLVRDEGTGIPKEHIDKIFDPYFTTKQKGSGLGLAATYSIIRRHDGHITVSSEIGQGAEFSLYLPASSGKVMPVVRAGQTVAGSGRILIMDDEKDMRSTTGAMLERLGYAVEFAGDGDEAIERYRAAKETGAPFNAVIMDLTIPGGMGGREAVEKLLAVDPEARAVVSSGYSHDPVMAEYWKYGFRDVVVKPYRIRELSEVISRVVSGKKA